MQHQHFLAGEIIFRAGEPSRAVYVIAEGAVAITRPDGRQIARLQAGDLFGESGVLENRARSATATALVPTQVLATEADVFFQAFGMNNERALTLVKLLCRRLRDTSARASLSETADAPAPDTRRSPIQLIPDDEQLTQVFGLKPVPVDRLPFRVGNRFGGGSAPIESNQGYCIPAHGDPELSAPHFEIIRRDGRIGIHDLGSRAGTLVNGMLIGRGGTEAFHPLKPGDNCVIAGRAGSPYRFCVRWRGQVHA